MKQKANYLEQNEEKDIDKTTSLAENLDVFCVSATEYMKLKQLVAIGDGPAQVYHWPSHLQILKQFCLYITPVYYLLLKSILLQYSDLFKGQINYF